MFASPQPDQKKKTLYYSTELALVAALTMWVCVWVCICQYVTLKAKDKMQVGNIIRSDCRSQNLGLRAHGCKQITLHKLVLMFCPLLPWFSFLSHITPLISIPLPLSLLPPLALSRRSFPKPQRGGGGARNGEDALVIRAVTQVNSIILFSYAARRVCPFHSQLP